MKKTVTSTTPEPDLENPVAVATYSCNQRNTVFNLSPVFESVHQPVLKASATSNHLHKDAGSIPARASHASSTAEHCVRNPGPPLLPG